MAYEHQLKEEERPLARALWEQVFPEDTQAFLDAFCVLKKDNVILGVTVREAKAGKQSCADDGMPADESGADRLAAMIQLDRCMLAFGKPGGRINAVGADYIVGVSTLPEFRHRGLMRTLLTEAVREGAARRDPFIFLMPANEQVYLPFGFRTVYLQTNFLAPDADALAAAGKIAAPEDCEALAAAASNVLTGESDTYLIRDERYFRDLIVEMGAEDGKVIALSPEGTGDAGRSGDSNALSGYVCFWPGENGTALVRELVLPGPEYGRFIMRYRLRSVHEAPDAQAPKIMVRPLDPAEFVKPLTCGHTRKFTLAYRDDILTEYSGLRILTVGPEGGTLTRAEEAQTAAAEAFRLPDLDPASLAEWVLGGHAPAGAEDVLRPDRILLNEWI